MSAKKKETKHRKAKKIGSKKAVHKTTRTVKSTHSPRKEEKISLRTGKRASVGRLAASRSHHQQALRESEEKYRTIFNSARDGIGLIDSETGSIIDCNAEFENLSGRKLKELKKMKIWELRPPQKVEAAKKKFFEIRNKETGGSRELEFQKPNGEIVPVEFVSKVIKIQDKQYIQSNVRDITKRRQAEERLRDSEKKYRTLVENAQEGIGITDTDENIIFINQAFAGLLGYRKEELLGLNLKKITDKIEFDKQRKETEKRKKGESSRYETKLYTKSGKPRYFSMAASPIYNDQGTFAGTMGLLTDITERKQAKEALEWELAVNRELAKLSGALITPSSSIEDIANIVLDAAKSLTYSEHGFVSSIDPKTRDTVAHTLTKMMGKQCLVRGEDRRIRFPIGPDGLYPALWGYVLNSRRALFTNSPDTHHASLGIPEGHLPINNFLSVPAIIGEELVGQIALANSPKEYTRRDLEAIKRLAELYAMAIQRRQAEEALRESEEKFRNLAEQSPNMIFINKKGRIVYANQKCEEIMGFKREEFYSPDFDFLRLIAPETKDLIKSSYSRHMKGEDVPPYEYILITREGKRIEAILTSKLINYEGEAAILGIVTDITQRKKAEEEIKRLNESLKARAAELAAANKELEAFSYSVSHDLRAPLRTIDSFTRALLEDYSDKLDQTGKDYLKRVRVGTQRMGELIDSLLNLSLVMRAEMKRQEIDLSKLADSIAAELRKTEPERKVEFVIQKEVSGLGDPRLLQTVLENLLGNAWKFTSKHPHAKIEFGTAQKEEQTVYFVRDNGAGFDMSHVDRLFIPFQRLHSTAEFCGNGIGLAIASRIINRHGARIWAEGQVEKGATFYFTLQ